MTTTLALFASISSSGTSREGHSDSSWLIQGGPFYHLVECTISSEFIPLVAMSTRFCSLDTHKKFRLLFRISFTLFLSNRGSLSTFLAANHASTNVKSDQA